MTKRRNVPKHEPEVLQAAARRAAGKAAASTTSLRSLNILGIEVSSLDRKAEELQLIADILAAMPPTARAVITKAWCDSRTEAFYTLTLWRCDENAAHSAAECFEKACKRLGGGHNGIHVERAGGRSFSLDPCWTDE
jgi:hypothetical protein